MIETTRNYIRIDGFGIRDFRTGRRKQIYLSELNILLKIICSQRQEKEHIHYMVKLQNLKMGKRLNRDML